MKTDIQIAQSVNPKPITEIAKQLGLNQVECYGNAMAKITQKVEGNEGKLVLVTSITPTKAGEGKSTTTVGLVDSLNAIGIKTVGALREPSMGPVFGIKGGAAGGGYAQVIPMEDINLHFTGDMHAISAANNLISASIDNHIYHGNQLDFDLNRITFKRCMDMNDRALRNVQLSNRHEQFNITVASEIMAILCLSSDLNDFMEKTKKILLGYSNSGQPIFCEALEIEGALGMIMSKAIYPNLVQTLEHNPFLVHGGPFANIAHGCNSIIATKTALKLGDVVVTEAGFGADLGAEKFLDIKCRIGDLKPQCVVVVATIRALKQHGGVAFEDLSIENVDALKLGFENLQKHLETVQAFGLPYVVAINQFKDDTDNELKALSDFCNENHHPMALSNVFAQGSKGGIALAKAVAQLLEVESSYTPLYDLDDDFETKVIKIAQKAYGAKDVIFSDEARLQLKEMAQWTYLPVCMAKTPMSLSDNEKLKGRPRDFSITIRELRPSLGAGFMVCLTGKVMTMPGLPKNPAAKRMKINNEGKFEGLS